MQNIKRNWNLYNLRLVNRGRPSNYLLPAVENRENAFGEYTFSKTKEMREKELMLKALVYNKYIA